MISGAARAGHGDATRCGRITYDPHPTERKEATMIYHLHLTEKEQTTLALALLSLELETDELMKETMRKPDQYTNDLLTLYRHRKDDINALRKKVEAARG